MFFLQICGDYGPSELQTISRNIPDAFQKIKGGKPPAWNVDCGKAAEDSGCQGTWQGFGRVVVKKLELSYKNKGTNPSFYRCRYTRVYMYISLSFFLSGNLI